MNVRGEPRVRTYPQLPCDVGGPLHYARYRYLLPIYAAVPEQIFRARSAPLNHSDPRFHGLDRQSARSRLPWTQNDRDADKFVLLIWQNAKSAHRRATHMTD